MRVKEAFKETVMTLPKSEKPAQKEKATLSSAVKKADPIPLPLRGAVKLLESLKREEGPIPQEKPSMSIPWVHNQQQRILSEAFQVLGGLFLKQGAPEPPVEARSIIPQWVIAPYLASHLETRKGKKAKKKSKEEEEREKRYPFEG